MPVRDLGGAEVWANNFPLAHLCNYVLANYTAAGTVAPVDGDLVTFGTAGPWQVVRLPDNQGSKIGRVKGNPNTVDLTVNVEWLDCLGFVKLNADDLSAVTLGNSAIKHGNTTVANYVDAAAGTGNLIVVEKSAATGAGWIICAIFAA